MSFMARPPADVCVSATITVILLHKKTGCVLGLLVIPVSAALFPDQPPQPPVAWRLLFKACLFLPGLQQFPGACCPSITHILFPFPSHPSLPQVVFFRDFLHPGGALKTENRVGCGEKAQRSAWSIFVCHLSHFSLHCSATVTAAWILMKRRPLWLLLHGAGADIFLSCLPFKCPFCVSYW